MLVETAARSLPGIDHVGITIASRDGEMETRAGSDAVRAGPGPAAVRARRGPVRARDRRSSPVTTVEWASREHTVAALRASWPSPRACGPRWGCGSYTERETLGGLNMYSTSSDTIDADVVPHGGAVRGARVPGAGSLPAAGAAEHGAPHAQGHRPGDRHPDGATRRWTRTVRSPTSPGSRPTATSSCARSRRRSWTCATTRRRRRCSSYRAADRRRAPVSRAAPPSTTRSRPARGGGRRRGCRSRRR